MAWGEAIKQAFNGCDPQLRQYFGFVGVWGKNWLSVE